MYNCVRCIALNLLHTGFQSLSTKLETEMDSTSPVIVEFLSCKI